MSEDTPAIGIIGGSGLYQMEGVENPAEQRVETPFGDPSDTIIGGQMHGRQVYFLPRHGRGHRLLPHELNHRANIYALRFAQCSLDHLRDRGRQLAGKICAARCALALAVFRPDEPARRAHIFRRRHRRARELRGADFDKLAPDSGRGWPRVGRQSPQRRNLREHGRAGLFDARGIGVESPHRASTSSE